MIDLVQDDKFFETNFARIKPFLLSRCRDRIVYLIKPHIKDVVWCHTDGFITTKQFEVPESDEIGTLKYEGYCPNVIINNCVNKKGDFI